MTFNATLETTNSTAKIHLQGELDASAAPLFREQVEKAAQANVKHLVLLMQDLEYMASAGLRVLIFAKQKMGPDVDLYLIGTQEMVMDTLTKTGFDQSVILQDRYEE